MVKVIWLIEVIKNSTNNIVNNTQIQVVGVSVSDAKKDEHAAVVNCEEEEEAEKVSSSSVSKPTL